MKHLFQKFRTGDKSEKIVSFFFNYPLRSFHVRELSRLSKIPISTVSRYVKLLIKKNMIVVKRKKPILEVLGNFESDSFIREKREFNIKQISNSGLLDFLISEYNHPEVIVLFGSYAKGEDIEKSDVDIIVITDKRLNLKLEKFEKILNRKIHLLEMKHSEIKGELLNNIINGVIVYGYLKIK